MKIDVTQQIAELDGTPMVTSKQVCLMCGQTMGVEEPMTVRLATTRALAPVYQDERNLTGDDKIIRFHLALRIMDEDEPDLEAKEIVLAKEMVGKMYGAIVVGRVWAILDPKAKEADDG